jgi:hypothetical protein
MLAQQKSSRALPGHLLDKVEIDAVRRSRKLTTK